MAYTRYNESNVAENPQPGSSTVNHFSGNEGWATKSFKNWNADFQARNKDNGTRTPGTFQARDKDNATRTPAAYQRRDKDNSTVSA